MIPRNCEKCGTAFEAFPSKVVGGRARFCSRKCGAVAKADQARAIFEQRFWAKVDQSGSCWIWTGSLSTTGYGKLGVGSQTDGTRRNSFAHRIAYELRVGPIPDGFCVCHHCDNPRCVFPRHLFLGRIADNNRDMRAKGRHAHGERQGHAKLTSASVAEIRRRYLTGGVFMRELAKEFGVSQSHVSDVVRGKVWASAEF